MQGKYFFIGKDHPIVQQNTCVRIYDFDGHDCLAEYSGQVLLLPVQSLRKNEKWQDSIHRQKTNKR